MPTLQWIGKDAVINHHLEVPVKTLEKKYTEGSENSENKIIHGDNLEALKALLPEYEGRVKCVYIDPPYNTGNENWVYNDNVNSPRIRKWLGEVVGKETEDLTRHDKWLCMMYPRLKLLHQLLANDGVIFISIDDNEQEKLKLICEEIFGHANFLAQIIWERAYAPVNLKKHFSESHDYIICYAKNISMAICNGLPRSEEAIDRYSNPDNDPRGVWKASDATVGPVVDDKVYEITLPSGRIVKPSDGRCWVLDKDRFNEFVDDNRIWFGPNGNSTPSIKKFLSEVKQGITPMTIWKYTEVGHSQDATKELKEIFGGKSVFTYPKSAKLIERIIGLYTDKDSLILDSFAGSGTTAHAVLNLNKRDGGNRKFILVEMEDYAESITAERVRRVINGYPFKGKVEEEIFSKKLTVKNILNAENILQEAEVVAEERQPEFEKISIKIQDNCIKVIGTKVFDEMMEGTGGDFSFYELGEAIMVNGNLNDKLDVETIREFVWYSETHSPYTKQKYAHPYLLGRHDDTDYYFYYEPGKETTLGRDFLATITQKAERYLIYADNCLLPQDDMAKYNIVFKKIPRDIKTF